MVADAASSVLGTTRVAATKESGVVRRGGGCDNRRGGVRMREAPGPVDASIGC